jgi:hypothetical protein
MANPGAASMPPPPPAKTGLPSFHQIFGTSKNEGTHARGNARARIAHSTNLGAESLHLVLSQHFFETNRGVDLGRGRTRDSGIPYWAEEEINATKW